MIATDHSPPGLDCSSSLDRSLRLNWSEAMDRSCIQRSAIETVFVGHIEHTIAEDGIVEGYVGRLAEAFDPDAIRSGYLGTRANDQVISGQDLRGKLLFIAL